MPPFWPMVAMVFMDPAAAALPQCQRVCIMASQLVNMLACGLVNLLSGAGYCDALHSAMVRPPLLRLQCEHSSCRLSGWSVPPRDLGKIWSTSMTRNGKCVRQFGRVPRSVRGVGVSTAVTPLHTTPAGPRSAASSAASTGRAEPRGRTGRGHSESQCVGRSGPHAWPGRVQMEGGINDRTDV